MMQKPFYKPVALLLSLFLLAFLTVGVTLALNKTLPETPPQPNTTDNTDLRVESFTLSPAAPLAPRQPMTLTAVLRNSGTTSVTGRRVYVYLNPTERPPISTTAPLKEFVAALTWPAGDAQTIEYGNFTVNATGCDNVAYVWVDPLERIDESDEANNLAEIRFCVEHPHGAVGRSQQRPPATWSRRTNRNTDAAGSHVGTHIDTDTHAGTHIDAGTGRSTG